MGDFIYVIDYKEMSFAQTHMWKLAGEFREHKVPLFEEQGFTDLSMSKIGCSLDQLLWKNVSVMIEEVFETADIKITVYTLRTNANLNGPVFSCSIPTWS